MDVSFLWLQPVTLKYTLSQSRNVVQTFCVLSRKRHVVDCQWMSRMCALCINSQSLCISGESHQSYFSYAMSDHNKPRATPYRQTVVVDTKKG